MKLQRYLSSGAALAIIITVLAGPEARAGSIIKGGIDPAAAMGIQLDQPATTVGQKGTAIYGVIAAQDRFNTYGFADARPGDKVAITVITPGQQWSVQNLRTGVVQTVGMTEGKLAPAPRKRNLLPPLK
jgi:hypothetical protein